MQARYDESGDVVGILVCARYVNAQRNAELERDSADSHLQSDQQDLENRFFWETDTKYFCMATGPPANAWQCATLAGSMGMRGDRAKSFEGRKKNCRANNLFFNVSSEFVDHGTTIELMYFFKRIRPLC